MAEENARFRHDLGALDHRRQQFHLIADVADFPIDAVFTATVVGQHAAVKFLRTDARLSPEKIQQTGGAARNALIGEQPDNARTDQ